MKKIIKALFIVSDIIAWFLCVFTAIGAMAFPFIGPIYARMQHRELSDLSILATSFALIFITIGAYAITKHKLIGIAPITFSMLIIPFTGSPLHGVIFLNFLVLVAFCVPCILTFMEVRSHV